MKLILSFLSLVLFILSISTWSIAGQIDDLLIDAKKQGRFVMLELGSVGCIPCENMRPVMNKLSTMYKGKLDVIFIDVRRDPEPARRFRVFGIPTQVFLDRNGKEFHRHVGFYPYEKIAPVLKKAGI